MARITDNLVIQRVEDLLVIVDDNNGNETVIPIEAGVRLTAMAAYLTNPTNPDATWKAAREQLVQVGAVGNTQDN